MGASPNTKTLKQSLTMGLIYPAVLGNIIYLFLGALVAKLIPSLKLEEGNPSLAKWSLLAIALAFYFCDYLYTEFTLPDHFGWLFFCLEFVFLFCLYTSASAIHMKNDRDPQTGVIALCYLVFMSLYLLWDFVEFRRATYAKEKSYYRWIMGWEIVSIGLLVFWLSRALSVGVLLVILSVITAGFIWVVVEKFKLYRALKPISESAASIAP